MPHPEEYPPGSSAQKSAFKPVDSDQFQIGTRTELVSTIFSRWIDVSLGVETWCLYIRLDQGRARIRL